MVTALLYGSQIVIFALLGLLVHRIYSLYQSYYVAQNQTLTAASNPSIMSLLLENKSKGDSYDIKMECLHQAQIFAGVQMLQIKRNYGDLHQENLAWLREAISLYLIGSVDFIGKQANCSASTRKELITLVLKSNLKVSNDISAEYFSAALYRTLSSEQDLMVRAGAKAAKAWLANEKVPEELTLTTQLNHWGIFA